LCKRKNIMSKSRTQIRLQQITGSITSLKPSSLAAGTVVGSLSETNIPNAEKIFAYYSQAVSNIHGNFEFGASAPGVYKGVSGATTDGLVHLKPDSDYGSGEAGIALGKLKVGSVSSISAMIGSVSTLDFATTSIAKAGSYDGPSSIAAGTFLVFQDSGGEQIVYVLTSNFSGSDSSFSVSWLGLASSVSTMSGSSVSVKGTATGYSTVAGNNKMWRAVAARDLVSAHSTGMDIRAEAGTLLIDANGSSSADGVLVDSQNKVVIDAGMSSVGAIQLNAEQSSSDVQIKNAGTALMTIGGSSNLIAMPVDLQAMAFGADAATTLTHANGVGLVLGGGEDKLAFVQADGAESISSSADGQLDLAAGTLLKPVAPTIELEAATEVLLDTPKVHLEDDSASLKFGADEDVSFTHDGTTGMNVVAAGAFDISAGAQSVLKTTAAGLMLSGATNVGIAAAAGPVFLDGSQSVGIQTDGTFAFSAIAALAGENAKALLFETPSSSEAATYISNFSTSTSVLGAINSLKSSISSSEPTLFSGSIALAGVAAGTATTLSKLAGDISAFSTSVQPNQLDVYVNGQLMKSGSETDRANGTVDYAVAGSNQLKFSFALVVDDLVTAIDRT
jgi:hypothetical protein